MRKHLPCDVQLLAARTQRHQAVELNALKERARAALAAAVEVPDRELRRVDIERDVECCDAVGGDGYNWWRGNRDGTARGVTRETESGLDGKRAALRSEVSDGDPLF